MNHYFCCACSNKLLSYFFSFFCEGSFQRHPQIPAGITIISGNTGQSNLSNHVTPNFENQKPKANQSFNYSQGKVCKVVGKYWLNRIKSIIFWNFKPDANFY